MIEGDFMRVPAVVAAALWLFIAIRRRYGVYTSVIGVLAIAHLAMVAALTFFPFPVQSEVLQDFRAMPPVYNNLVPMVSLVRALTTGSTPSVVYQSAGNFLMLAPLGIYAPLLFAGLQRWWRTALVGLGVCVGIEALQLGLSAMLGYTYKIADIDDVILNTAGAILGYAAFRLLCRWLTLEPASVAIAQAP